jgi:hypothetical protein
MRKEKAWLLQKSLLAGEFRVGACGPRLDPPSPASADPPAVPAAPPWPAFGPQAIERLRFCRRFEQAKKVAVHRLVAGHDVAADPGGVALLEVGDISPGLAHQD